MLGARSLFMLVALGGSPAAALASGTLVALSDCPSVGPNRACLPVEFRLGEGGTAKKAGATVDSTEKIMKLYSITGRLSGGRIRAYNLAVIYDRRDTEATIDGPGVLPYRGRTRSDRPVILTDHGPSRSRRRTSMRHHCRIFFSLTKSG